MALLQCATHAFGSFTGRRSSPSGRRSWGRGRDRPVCRSSCAAHGALFSLTCRHTHYTGIRFILLMLAGAVPAAAAAPSVCTPTPKPPPAGYAAAACVDRPSSVACPSAGSVARPAPPRWQAHQPAVPAWDLQGTKTRHAEPLLRQAGKHGGDARGHAAPGDRPYFGIRITDRDGQVRGLGVARPDAAPLPAGGEWHR